MTYHNVRFPRFMEMFAKGIPEFSTTTAATSSGREVRRADRDVARQKYLLENCVLSQNRFEEFNAFFRAREGQNYSFRFRDLADCAGSCNIDQSLLSEDNSFRLFKLYPDKISPYIRYITKLDGGKVKVFINKIRTNAVNIDYESGVIKLLKPLNSREKLSVEFAFDVEVRFASDSFSYKYDAGGYIAIDRVELIEVIN